MGAQGGDGRAPLRAREVVVQPSGLSPWLRYLADGTRLLAVGDHVSAVPISLTLQPDRMTGIFR